MFFSDTSSPMSSTESASKNFLKSLHEIVKYWSVSSDIAPDRLTDEIKVSLLSGGMRPPSSKPCP